MRDIIITSKTVSTLKVRLRTDLNSDQQQKFTILHISGLTDAFRGAYPSIKQGAVLNLSYIKQVVSANADLNATIYGGDRVLVWPELVTFTITPTPSNATVTINGVVGASASIIKDAAVVWSVARATYTTQTATIACLTTDKTLAVTLVLA